MVDIDELPNLNQEESDLAALLVAGPNQEGRDHIITETETLLRTIDNLRDQLRQAQAERDIEQEGRQGAERRRDAAIERAERAEQQLADIRAKIGVSE